MTKTERDKAIRKAMQHHVDWLNKWTKDGRGLSVMMISPRGKQMTYSAYCLEVDKQMNKTVKKIHEALFEEVSISARDK